MDLLTISLFCVLEVAILLLVFAAFLKRRNTQLQRRIEALETAPPPAESFESITSGYLPYLEKQLIDTRARLELSQMETGDGDPLALALENRLDLLEREKRVVELCNDYPKRRWEHVGECYSPPPQEEVADTAGDTADVSAATASATPEGGELDEPVAQLAGILGHQGDALESFRQVFEVIKKEPDPQALKQLEKELRELERRFREARTCVEIMEQENQRLQYKVEQGNRRLDRAEAEKNENIADLQNEVGKQKRNISELNHLIDGLQLEAEKAAELQAKLDQFDLSTREMNMCIQIMEEENEFLREQVQALTQMEQQGAPGAAGGELEERNEQLVREVEMLQGRLKEKDDRLTALEREYASLEQQYLALYEQAQT